MNSNNAIAIWVSIVAVSMFPMFVQADGTQEDMRTRTTAVVKSAVKVKAKLTRAELERRPQVLRKTGGFIDVAAKGTAVVVLEGRKKKGGAASQFVEVFGRLSRYSARIQHLDLETVEEAVETACNLIGKKLAVYALAVVDVNGPSGLSIFPEERIAVVNVAKYKNENDPLVSEVRVVKELWRALGFVSGIGYAPFGNDVLQPVFSVSELDTLEYQVMQPLNFQKMYQVFSRFDVKRSRHIPYRVAVIEGWAPTPTNDYQKAVWDEVRSEKERGPAKGLKIEPKR